MLLHMDHVLAVDGSSLEKVVWQLPTVALRHSLRFNLCLLKTALDYWQMSRYVLPGRSFRNQSASEGTPAQATRALAGLQERRMLTRPDPHCTNTTEVFWYLVS